EQQQAVQTSEVPAQITTTTPLPAQINTPVQQLNQEASKTSNEQASQVMTHPTVTPAGYCKPTLIRGLSWSAIRPDTTEVMPCPQGSAGHGQLVMRPPGPASDLMA
ncbi:unnamed protein product, partial [Sphagnum tenellum]